MASQADTRIRLSTAVAALLLALGCGGAVGVGGTFVSCGAPHRNHAVTADWTLHPSSPVANEPTTVSLRLTDPAQQPLARARLQVVAHMTHPGMAPVTADVQEREPGVYEARVPFSMAGDWVLTASGKLADGAAVTLEYPTPTLRVGASDSATH